MQILMDRKGLQHTHTVHPVCVRCQFILHPDDGQPDQIIFLMLGIAGILACFGSVGCGVLDTKKGPKFAIRVTMVAAAGALGVSIVGIIGRSVSYGVAYGVLAVLTVIALILISTVDEKLIGRN